MNTKNEVKMPGTGFEPAQALSHCRLKAVHLTNSGTPATL